MESRELKAGAGLWTVEEGVDVAGGEVGGESGEWGWVCGGGVEVGVWGRGDR